jgi:serine/threonine protein kinase/tetratricopeptide (TPR) repeat protein
MTRPADGSSGSAQSNENDSTSGRQELTDGTTVAAALSGSPARGNPSLAVGAAFGPRYHIIRKLGEGGMGAVYQAWDQELGVAVALKVIRPDTAADPGAAAEMERRFKRELLLARQVTDPNVVRIHDLGDLNGIKYISMPYIKGEDLSTRLRREKKLTVPSAIQIARQIAAGLEAAHAADVVHRDLKPANIMIRDDDNRVLIMDFGIARLGPAETAATAAVRAPSSADTIALNGVGAAARRPSAAASEVASLVSLTQGHIVGTVAYMAPEQAMGLPVDHRADLYAFGMILAECLVGRRGRQGETPTETLRRRVTEPPVSLRETDASIPESLDAIVMRCLQLNPSDRFQTTADLVGALGRIDDEGQLIPEPVVKRFTPLTLTLAALLLVAVGTGTWYFARGTGVVPAHPPMSVLIGDFENTTSDATLQTTVEQSMGAALEGASFISTFPRDQARKLAVDLQSAHGVDEPTARLIAVREGLSAILLGRIEPRGSGYRLSARALDPQGKQVATATSNASSRADLLSAVSQIASRIRDQFGDTTSAGSRQADLETFTSASLDATAEYAQGQDLAMAGRDEDAILHYRAAIDRDPRFGRAYSGLAVSAYKVGRSAEAEDAYKKAFSLLDRMTEREKLRTLGGYYLQFTKSYDKAVDNYAELVRRYPADGAGHGMLAYAYFGTLNFSKAWDEGREAMRLAPRSPIVRSNNALYAMYASDFTAAVNLARQVVTADPKYFKAYLPIAIGALDAGNIVAAKQAYLDMSVATATGRSLGQTGLADIDLYLGRYPEAERRLRDALAEDQQSRRTQGAIAKQIALAEALLPQGKTAQAQTAALAAVALGQGLNARVPAARLLLRAGDVDGALELAGGLSGDLQPQNRAYGKVIEAEAALARHRPSEAVDALIAARKFADVWLGRFDLGVAYVTANSYTEAVSELELANKRRGEATAMFLDDWPTVHELATLPYWLGRAHEAIGATDSARQDYEKFLAGRTAGVDPLIADARRRALGLSSR